MPRLKEQGCLHSRNNMAAMKLFELRGFRAEWSRALWRRLRQRRQRPRLHTHWSDSSQGEDRGACVGACGSGGRGGGPPTVAALRVAERRKRAAYPEPNGGPQNNSWCLGVRRFFFLARGGEVLHLAAPRPTDGVSAKRQPTGRARTREVKHVAQRECVIGARQQRHGRHPERRAGDSALQGDGQDAPPTAGPALCRGRTQRGWGALDAKPEQAAKELLALVVPAAPDLSGEHDEPLRAAAREFRVACDFAPAGSVEGDPRARASAP